MARKVDGLLLECTHPDHQGPRMLPRGWFSRSRGGWHSHCRECRKPSKSKAAAVRRERIRGVSALYCAQEIVTAKDIRHMMIKQRWRCACGCGRLLFKYHVDHKMAIANGGRHVLANMQLMWPLCNLKKGKK